MAMRSRSVLWRSVSTRLPPGDKVVGFALAGLLIFGAGSKLWALISPTQEFDFSLAAGTFSVLLILYEASIAVWLYWGRWPRPLYATTFATFAAFGAITLYFAWTGVSTCSCMGAWETAPLTMFLIDACALVALCLFPFDGAWTWTPLLRRGGIVYAAILAGVAAPFVAEVAWLRISSWSSEARLVLPQGTNVRLIQGERADADIVEDQLLLGNEGSQPLSFNLSWTCGCSSITPRSGTIEPGQALPVLVRVRLDGMEHRGVIVTIQSNSKDNAHQRVQMRAERRLLGRATPEAVDFQTVRAGQTVSRQVSFQFVQRSPRHTRVSARLRKGKVTLEETESAHSWRVIWTSSNVDTTVLNDTIEFVASDGTVLTRVSVRGRAVPLIHVVPPKIVLPSSPGEPATATFLVRRTDGQPLGSLAQYDAPGGVIVQDIAKTANGAQCLRLTDTVVERSATSYPLRLRFSTTVKRPDLFVEALVVLHSTTLRTSGGNSQQGQP
jgi:hypothetical protein